MKKVLHNGLELLMLATIAITQPMFDLYGKNLPIFSAAKVSQYEILFFIFALALVPAFAAIIIENSVRLVNRQAGAIAHDVFVGLFSFVFGLAICRQVGISFDALAYLVSLGVAALAIVGLRRITYVRTFAAYLSALAPILTLLLIVQVQPVLGGPISKLVSVEASPDAVPVTMIVFDESPLFALLNSEGEINAERFPGFAKLATLSTWHRNATAVSQQTTQAVPAIFTSNIPSPGDLPFLSYHPDNIFTMMQDKYPINGYESVTSLCPRNVCASAYPTDLERLYLPRLKAFLKDASVVFGQRVLPSNARKGLPSVGESWGGFLNTDAIESSENAEEPVNAKFDLTREGGPFFQYRMMNESVERMLSTKGASATVMHLTIPHRPWFMTPTLQRYQGPPFLGDYNPEVGDRPKDYYQRYLYQLVAVDAMVNDLITKMQNAGLWDKSLVIITSDHGISFEPGYMQRATDFSNAGQVTDLYTVPMFVKMPNQKAGKTDDCAVTNLDLLPTIVEVTGISTSAQMAGTSLVNACPQRELRPMTTPKESRQLASSFELVKERSNRYAQWLPRDGAIREIAGEISAQTILGQSVTSSGASGQVSSWASRLAPQFQNIKKGVAQLAPVYLFGTITVDTALSDNADGLVLIDGKVAGVINELAGAKPGVVEFQTLLDYTLLTPGNHSVSLVIRTRDGITEKYEMVGPLES